jgi:hypothetical protein
LRWSLGAVEAFVDRVIAAATAGKAQEHDEQDDRPPGFHIVFRAEKNESRSDVNPIGFLVADED